MTNIDQASNQTLVLPSSDYRKLILIMIVVLVFFTCFFVQMFPWTLLLLSPIPFLVLQESGIELDFEAQRIRNYHRNFFKRKGKWIALSQYKNIVVIKKSGTKSTAGTIMTSTLATKGELYQLYLMDESHTDRFYLHYSQNRGKLEGLINQITWNTPLTEADYLPVTWERRRRRSR